MRLQSAKDLVKCCQSVPEKMNHHHVHFVQATMNQEPVLMFEEICKVFGKLMLDLFTTWNQPQAANLHISIPDPMAWKEDLFQH